MRGQLELFFFYSQRREKGSYIFVSNETREESADFYRAIALFSLVDY